MATNTNLARPATPYPTLGSPSSQKSLRRHADSPHDNAAGFNLPDSAPLEYHEASAEPSRVGPNDGDNFAGKASPFDDQNRVHSLAVTRVSTTPDNSDVDNAHADTETSPPVITDPVAYNNPARPSWHDANHENHECHGKRKTENPRSDDADGEGEEENGSRHPPQKCSCSCGDTARSQKPRGIPTKGSVIGSSTCLEPVDTAPGRRPGPLRTLPCYSNSSNQPPASRSIQRFMNLDPSPPARENALMRMVRRLPLVPKKKQPEKQITEPDFREQPEPHSHMHEQYPYVSPGWNDSATWG